MQDCAGVQASQALHKLISFPDPRGIRAWFVQSIPDASRIVECLRVGSASIFRV